MTELDAAVAAITERLTAYIQQAVDEWDAVCRCKNCKWLLRRDDEDKDPICDDFRMLNAIGSEAYELDGGHRILDTNFGCIYWEARDADN